MPFRSVRPIVLAAFFASGLAGLTHEVAWTRLLRHVMGNTTFAITTVLCAFMGGLALGSYAAGRWLDRRRDPLTVFAVLEGSIGLYSAALPWLIVASEPVYRLMYQNTRGASHVFSLLAFLYCAAVLLVPATLMGATLPVLTRFFARSPEHAGRSAGTLYAINTFGAVAGVGMAGFLLIPGLGVSRTIWLACVVNLLIAGAALWLRRAAGPQADGGPQAEPPAAKRAGRRKRAPAAAPAIAYGGLHRTALLWGYGFSGAAALVYEIAWTRVLSLLVGSTVYAFSLMLTAFILGLAGGSLAFARIADRVRDRMRALALLQVAIGLSALLVVPLFERLPFVVTRMIANAEGSFWRLQGGEFALALIVMLVPTTLMGASFPLATRMFAEGRAEVGRSVGTVYAFNTLGSIAGSFLGGFVLIPLLGIQRTILAAVLVNLGVGCAFLALTRSLPALRRGLAAAAVVVAAGLIFAATPRWDPARLSFGPFVQARALRGDVVRSKAALERELARSEVLFHREGLSTTVTVKRFPDGVRYLYVNGKIDASSSGNLPTQKLLAQLPLLLHPHPRRVLQIGLASGITLGSAGRHPLDVLDCVEISEAVVEATRFFDAENGKILEDPRARVIVADGRNHLALAGESYDVIISQPSNPWIAGVADLFTREFFALVHRSLTPGGVACIWLESSNIGERSFRSVIRAFDEAFGGVTVWSPVGSKDYFLIGARGPLTVNAEALARRMEAPGISREMRSAGTATVPRLLGSLVMGPRAARRFAQGAPLHTDDNALLEFATPRELILGDRGRALREAIERYREADFSFLEGADTAALGATTRDAGRVVEANGLFLRARAAAERGDAAGAIARYREVVALDPDHPKAHNNLGAALGAQGRLDEAIVHLLEATRIDPADAGAQYNLGNALMLTGRLHEAASAFRMALRSAPQSAAPLAGLAWILATHPDDAARDAGEAVRLAEQASRLTAGADARTLDVLAAAYAAAGRYDDALAAARSAAARASGGQADTIRARMELYRRGVPYRQAAQGNAGRP